MKKDSGDFHAEVLLLVQVLLLHVEVLILSDMRGPSAVARTLSRETEASRELRLKLAEERKAISRFETLPQGKPSKRDHRELNRLRGR